MEFRQRRTSEEKKPTRYYSDIQEKSVAKAIKGKQTANSGATAYQKGDVLDDLFLVECKTKTKESESISVKKEWFDKNLSESIYMKKPYSCVVINFGPNTKNYYIIDEQTFLEMKEALEEKRQNEQINT